MATKAISFWDLLVSFSDLNLGDALTLFWKFFSQIPMKYVLSFIGLFIFIKILLALSKNFIGSDETIK